MLELRFKPNTMLYRQSQIPRRKPGITNSQQKPEADYQSLSSNIETDYYFQILTLNITKVEPEIAGQHMWMSTLLLFSC